LSSDILNIFRAYFQDVFTPETKKKGGDGLLRTPPSI
jgi:hypothetical protein